jgi:hypothetical protein
LSLGPWAPSRALCSPGLTLEAAVLRGRGQLAAEADLDRARTDAEVPIDYAGSYSVRFVLDDPDGVELDRAETDTFEVVV